MSATPPQPAVVLPDAVGPLQDVRDPADLPLRVGDLQVGEAHEHAAEQVVHQREGGVGVRQRRAHRRRGVRRGRRHLRRRPDVHVDDGLRLGAGPEERVPVVVGVVHAGQAEERRDLAEADGAHAALRVAPHLVRRQLGVPQRDEAQRDEPAARVGAPLLDHPVVVGLHAEQPELPVLGLGEGLAAEAGERREAQRRLDVVGVHVLEPGLHLVGARAHLLVGDALHGHLVAGHPHGRVHPQQRTLEVLVVPPVHRHALRTRASP